MWCPCRERACSHRWRASTTHVDGRGKPRGQPLAYELIDGCESLGVRRRSKGPMHALCASGGPVFRLSVSLVRG